MGFSGRLGLLSHHIFQQPCEAGRTGIIPNEGNSGQGMFNSSAKVTQPSKQWSQNKTQVCDF